MRQQSARGMEALFREEFHRGIAPGVSKCREERSAAASTKLQEIADGYRVPEVGAHVFLGAFYKPGGDLVPWISIE